MKFSNTGNWILSVKKGGFNLCVFDFSKKSSIFDFCQLYQNICRMWIGKRTQCWVTAFLKTILTHCRFFHCYYLQKRKCPKIFISLISFFERYRKLPFVSTQHHCLFINFGRGKKRGSGKKKVRSKNYYKSSHCPIIKNHLFVVLFFIWHQEVSPNQEVALHQNSKYKCGWCNH